MPAAPTPELEFQKIGPEAPRGFDCGRSDQNEFLHNRACTYHELKVAATYLAFQGGECVGFITLALDSIELDQRERPDGVNIPRLPALKVAQLGVQKTRHGQGIGSDLLGFALWVARGIRGQAGCVYLSLDAKPDSIEFYEKNGFKKNKAEIRKRRQREGDRYDESTASISMRFDIREPEEGGQAVP